LTQKKHLNAFGPGEAVSFAGPIVGPAKAGAVGSTHPAASASENKKENAMQGLRCALFVIVAILGTAPASAQTPENLYAGKTIDLVIGYPPAGSNDVYARTLGRHIAKHIPGHPTIVPKNMPGGGSFLALAYLANVAPRDGTVIGIGAPTAPLDERLGSRGVRFKTAQFNWLGRIDSLVNIVFTWHTSPVKTFADAQRIESKLAATGAGSTVSIYPTVTNNVLGTRFKLIMGYKGSNEAQLAVERGEAEGHSTAWTAVKVAHPDWLPTHKINIIVQYALKPHPELADVPVVIDLARNDQERAILRAVMNATEVGTSFMTTPGVPPDRVAALRHAFDETMKDPDFLAEAARLRLTVNPLSGGELQKLVANVSNLPPDLVDKLRAAYAEK
jgi:tripartite-type tricarboxylate transporter receptor subunit TctC